MKRIPQFLLIFTLVLTLAACASAPAAQAAQAGVTEAVPQATAAPATDDAGQPGVPAPNHDGQPGEMQIPVESKLAYGTLQLEGSDLAVTAEQAAQLLPLWQQVQTFYAERGDGFMGGQGAAPQEGATPDPSAMPAGQDGAPGRSQVDEELSAVYAQIEEVMTGEQMAAIEATELNTEDMQSLLSDLGIEMPQRQEGDGAGMPPAGGPDAQGTPQEGAPAFDGTPQAGDSPQGTPQEGGNGGPGGRGGFGGGMSMGFDNLFVDPLVQLLQTRAAS
jgi:hypothetical protein